MKRYINIAILIGGLLILGGCMEDFLEEESFSNFTEANFYDNDEDFVFVVNGVYQPLDSYQNNLITRNALASATGTAPNDRFDQFDNSQMPGGVGGLWNNMYSGINRSNSALQRIDEFNFDDEGLKSRLKAECHFLRAFYYFNLVRWFGDVPLIVNPLTNFSSIDDVISASAIPRTTVQEVYTLIIEDLTLARESLPTIEQVRGTENLGRATVEAANTVLGLVYLTTEDFANAETTLLLVENSSGLALTEEYLGEDGCIGGSNTIESIFEIQFAGETSGSRAALANAFVPTDAVGLSPEQPNGDIFVELQFFDSFNSNDKRLQDFFRTQWNTNAGPVNFWEAADPMPHVKKYEDPDDETSDINQPLFRYADLLLMIAEAKARNNKMSEAEGFINQVRARAQVANVTTGLSQAQFLDTLFLERNKELCFEGHEYFDAKRFGKLISSVRASAQYNTDLLVINPDTTVLAIPRIDQVNIDETNLLFPLPENTVELNDAIPTNNPGY